MKAGKSSGPKFSFQPLTQKNWKDFEILFGPKGACGGCWCMTWRLTNREYELQKGEGNKKAMHVLVKKKLPIGVLAITNDKAAGWCAVAPRVDYTRLETSRILKPVDDLPVWSVSCFFIAKEFRNRGLSTALLKAAVDFAFSKGATIVEGYPVEPKKEKMPDVFAWTGLAPTFTKAGFKEVLRRGEERPIMRIYRKL